MLPCRRPRPLLAALLAALPAAAVLAVPPAGAQGVDPQPTTTTTVVEASPEVAIDPAPLVPASTGSRSAAASPDASTAQAAAALGLHSRPGSNRTIFIDFDGETVSGSQWSTDSGLPSPYVAEPWSLDADPSLSVAELARIERVWAAVAEDFAPFDVDVTTEDPGTAALDRTSAADQVFGLRALVTDSDTWQVVCSGTRCGGVAYIDVFSTSGASHLRHQPAWIFPENFNDDAKAMADVVSHEVGHTFGLEHDGTSTPANAYYRGQGAWGPLMGSPTTPLTQWSQGEYTAASNREDDLEIIARGAARVADTVGDTTSGAASGLPTGTQLISTRADVDVYRLRGCTGQVTVAASPASTGPDLDIDLRLLDATGAVVAADNPPVAASSSSVATGLGASVATTAGGGDLYVRVDGSGDGSAAATGYSDYGSLGQYSLRLTGSCDDGTGVPSSPLATTAASTAPGAMTVSWSPPASAGVSAVTGYRVTANPGGTVITTGASTRSATFTGLARGTTYWFTVVATNAVGNGPGATATATTPADRPGALAAFATTLTGDDLLATWDPPLDDGGSAVTGYRVRVGGAGGIDEVLGANVAGVAISDLPPGPVSVVVSAVNAAGEGPTTSRTVVVAGSTGTTGTGTGSPTAGSPAGPARVLTATAAPTLVGRAAAGRTLKVRPGAWNRPAALTYRWTLGSRVLATTARYRPRSAQVGKRLTLTVTATAAGSAPVVITLRTAKVRR